MKYKHNKKKNKLRKELEKQTHAKEESLKRAEELTTKVGKLDLEILKLRQEFDERSSQAGELSEYDSEENEDLTDFTVDVDTRFNFTKKTEVREEKKISTISSQFEAQTFGGQSPVAIER